MRVILPEASSGVCCIRALGVGFAWPRRLGGCVWKNVWAVDRCMQRVDELSPQRLNHYSHNTKPRVATIWCE